MLQYEDMDRETKDYIVQVHGTYRHAQMYRSKIFEQTGTPGDQYVLFTRVNEDTWRVIAWDAFLVAGLFKMEPNICSVPIEDAPVPRMWVTFIDIDKVLVGEISAGVARIPRHIAFSTESTEFPPEPSDFKDLMTKGGNKIKTERNIQT